MSLALVPPMRRRERRLRSWLRHERMTIAAPLAEAHHHSAPKVRAVPYSAPRSQKTRRGWERPGALKDPGPPWVEAVTVSYVPAGVLLLSTPALADTAADIVDTRTVAFLLSLALKVKKEEERQKDEEEDKKVKESLERVRLILERCTMKKKKRKKRLPRTSSRGVRAHTARPQNLDNIFRAPVFGCSEVSLLPEEYTRIGLFRCSTSGIISVIWAAWFSVDTCSCVSSWSSGTFFLCAPIRKSPSCLPCPMRIGNLDFFVPSYPVVTPGACSLQE